MKIMVFVSGEELVWESCRSISSGLRAAYERLEGVEVEWIRLSPGAFYHSDPCVHSDLRRVAAAIRRIRPERLVFLDQMPLPPVILRGLLHQLASEEIPPIFFHVYGDFTHFADEWLTLLNQAGSLRMHFFAASDSQKRLLHALLGKDASVSVCHFPVSQAMSFDQGLRNDFRKSEGVQDNERVLLYTGRISLQKNVDVLIRAFAEHCERHPASPWRLWIAGGVDDIGAPFMGLPTPAGYMYGKLERTLASIPTSVRSRIKFWDFVEKERMRGLLAASDLFASLSLYHDEDFGMAPAEALFSGLPCVLTDWGGYSSFVSRDAGWDCRLVPVRIVEYGHSLDLEPLHEALQYPLCLSSEERKNHGENFRMRFCDQEASRIISRSIGTAPPCFGDVGWRLPMFVRTVNFSSRRLNADFVPSAKGFYAEVYGSYISSTESL